MLGMMAGLGSMASSLPAMAAPAMTAMPPPVAPVIPTQPIGVGDESGSFFGDFGQGLMGTNKGGMFGMNQLPGKGDSLGMILGKILGGTKVSINSGGKQFSFNGPGLRKHNQQSELMKILQQAIGPNILGGQGAVIRSPAEPTTNVP